MLKIVKSSVAVAALLGLTFLTPAMAQDATEIALRMQQLEEQVRALTGQVQELSFEVKLLKGQGGKVTSGAIEQQQLPIAQPTQQRRLAEASAASLPTAEADVATIEEQPVLNLAPAEQTSDGLPDYNKAPEPKLLGSTAPAAKPDDGGFQGQVLVPPSQQEPGDDPFIDQNAAMPADPGDGSDAIETVSLSPETPEALYEKSNESLLRRQFGEAEAGFATFLQKYPEHGLAGSAQYWLGETFYAQGDFKRAAQSFLQGYKKYPKGRRAADSLLKLGISLNKLGQAEQACAAYLAVSGEYPKAVEARKRAQAEARRAGCAS